MAFENTVLSLFSLISNSEDLTNSHDTSYKNYVTRSHSNSVLFRFL